MARLNRILNSNIVYRILNLLTIALWAWVIISAIELGFLIKEEFHRRSIIERTHENPGDLYITDEISPFIDEFILDADSNNFNYHRIYMHLDEIILVDDLSGTKLGVCTYYLCKDDHLHGRIEILKELYNKDKFGFRSVLYHELGHWFGKKHTFCYNELIMHYTYDPMKSDSLKAIWPFAKDVFFNPQKYEQDILDCQSSVAEEYYTGKSN